MVEDEGTRHTRPPGRRAEDQWKVWDKRIRDAVIFLVGVVGVVHELFIVVEPRIAILIFLGSLIGVPFVLSADEKRSSNGNGAEESRASGGSNEQ